MPELTGSAGPPDDRTLQEVVAAVRERSDLMPRAVIVLGSGLAAAVSGINEKASFSYRELPGLPSPSVPGHEGRLILGELSGVPVAAFLGRFHYYEGHPMEVCTLPVRIGGALGARTAIVTAAVGAIAGDLRPGTLVVAEDHLNLMGVSPLRGWRNPDGSPPFVEMSAAYDPQLAELAIERAIASGVPVARGVYGALQGPAYETPVETEYLRRAGATVVGMSVVTEVLPARALGMRVLGLFAVTNAVGAPVEHEEVVRASNDCALSMAGILEDLLPHLDARDRTGRSSG